MLVFYYYTIFNIEEYGFSQEGKLQWYYLEFYPPRSTRRKEYAKYSLRQPDPRVDGGTGSKKIRTQVGQVKAVKPSREIRAAAGTH